MLTITSLFVWTIVAAHGNSPGYGNEYAWRHMGDFRGPLRCEQAAEQLALKPAQFRCIDTGRF